MILETVVERTRAGRTAAGWQGATTLWAHAHKEKQRGQRAAVRLDRVRSVLNRVEEPAVCLDSSKEAVWPAATSGQLPFPG